MSVILGILAAFVVVVAGSLTEGDPLSSLFSSTAALVVFGGTIAALMTQYGLAKLLLTAKSLSWMVKSPTVNMYDFITKLQEWNTTSRKEGVLQLESELETITDPFQIKALQMVIDSTDNEKMASTLKLMAEKDAHEDVIPGEVLEAAGGYAPTIGVMGAVLGLIHVMMQLNNPDTLGAGIATAFVATVYGVGGANLIMLPLGQRLSAVAVTRARQRKVMLEGFLMLKSDKVVNSVIQETLLVMMSSEDDRRMRAGERAAQAIKEAELASGDLMAEAA